MTHVHLIGIGGTGLSAIARVLLEAGETVSGSDRSMSPLAESLRDSGVRVHLGHRPENIQGADLVVRSSAIPDDNPEVQAALQAGIPVLKRSEFLGRLMTGRQVIAVAGTHGKTTTTAMLAWTLSALGQDPSYIIGGVSANLGANAHAGRGACFVIEADEYDRMFLGLEPYLAVVTNIEHDHPDCYPTSEDFYQAFRQFAGRVAPAGLLLACSDDRGAARLLEEVASSGRRVVSYGLERWLGRPCPHYCALDPRPNTLGGFDFEFMQGDPPPAARSPRLLNVSLQVPGLHNVRNALAALAGVDLLGLSVEEAIRAIGQFRGAGRRFELRGEAGGVTVIDDYAHHPTEILATLSAARSRYPGREIWTVWQPHTYSRTRALLDDFAAAFGDADHVLVTEIYAAREADPGDFSARQIVGAISTAAPGSDVHFTPELSTAADFLLRRLRSGDVLLVLSAGDADQLSGKILEGLRLQERRVS